ncbi:LLM class flavin-dependent oxidoreductase [Acetobacter vaccinii]|uniref:LLM class flavin-dependent oxidoreductase n=1 Tax=Acetobacter vaccinii TaxID=2592655 RepID=A0A5C1YKL5_9PROT|nr:LLM class flavin-dependent oxidoreductase [Acetobacter vaccinii]QEO16804.1 LLM class flavin-dependent oxidoreductase [Acetobacter vaccinii]
MTQQQSLQTFGFLNRLYAPDRTTAQQTYATALDLLRQAEDSGLDTGWVAQHHFHTETGALPAPLVFLAHATQHVRKLRLGTAVIILPLEPVLRLAEDAAVLEVLSNGRLELGLGRGFDTESLAGFDIAPDHRTELYRSGLTRLNAILRGQEVAPGLTMTPAVPQLLGRVWESTRDVAFVAANGNGLIAAPQLPEHPSHQELIAAYRAAWAAQGHEHPPRITLVRALIPGADKQTVEQEIGADILRYVRRFRPDAQQQDLHHYLREMGVLWGHPDDIVQELLADTSLPFVSHFAAQVQTFSTTPEQASRRLQSFTDTIVPALRAQVKGLALS